MTQVATESLPTNYTATAPATGALLAGKTAQPGWSYACLILAGLLAVVSNGRWIVPAAAWISPVFLLRFMRTQPALRAILLADLVMTGAALVSWQGMVPVPGSLYLVVVGFTAQWILAPFVVDRLLFRRFHGLARTLILPTAWVGVEYLNSVWNPYGTWGSAAYTQFGNLPLVQIVSVTGPFGISFLIGWFTAVVNHAWENEFAWPRVRCTGSLFAAVLALVLLAGGGRLAFFPPTGPTVRVSSISATEELRAKVDPDWIAKELNISLKESIPDALWNTLDQNSQPLQEYLAERTHREARAGARIVFWPEAHVILTKEAEPRLLELGRQIARSEGIYLGIGMGVARRHPTELKAENRFVLLDPQGNTLFDYTKQNPVPGGEAACSIIAVHDYCLPMAATPYGRIAAAICFDMDFPSFVRQAGVARTDILLDPSADWRAIDPLHTQMACMRAVELGCSVIRHTSGGLSAAVDYQGRLLASMDHFTTPATELVMVTQVPVAGVPTVYARIGDVFSWLCLAILLVLAGVGLVYRSHTAPFSVPAS
jgi:apolipoprotein N-acyltransferase